MFLNKLISTVFQLILALTLIINYFYFINCVWLPKTIHNQYAWIIIFLFHLILIMSIWSLIVISTSDPGQVPLYWGFYLGDSDSKRRRYCLMCNVFKPERCHHCSVCNRCVLNMDHHCPWINNCIGFFNRKFFIQMLFYLNLCLFFILTANAKFTFDILIKIIKNRTSIQKEFSEHLGYIFIYAFDIATQIIIGLFYKFHLTLIFENKTTIETIDKKGENFESSFHVGYYNNWTQVMGTSKLLWFLPLKLYLGIPKGNGIDWHDLLLEDIKKTGLNENRNNYSNYASNYVSYSNEKSSQNDKSLSAQPNSNPNPNHSIGSLYKNYTNDLPAINKSKNYNDDIIKNLNLHDSSRNNVSARNDQTSSMIELMPSTSKTTSSRVDNQIQSLNLNKLEKEQVAEVIEAINDIKI